MAEVTLSVGGYSHKVACRDGEELHLLRLGELVDAKAKEAQLAVGNAGDVRQLLFASLLFADEALEARKSAPTASATPSPPTLDIAALEQLANRAEALATKLEALA
jgi:cell division protein ZapA